MRRDVIRLAEPGDAAQLYRLNERFNGPSGSTVELMARSLRENNQELVIVADLEGTLAGFVCVQVKRSFCYEIPSAEVTEVFVDEEYRREGFGREMLAFAERAAVERFGPLGELTVLTGEDNLPARALYEGAGFLREDEVMFIKELS